MTRHFQSEGNILAYGSISKELKILENNSHRPSQLIDFSETLLGNVDSVDDHLSTRWPLCAVQNAEQGRFPGTTGSCEEGEFSG